MLSVEAEEQTVVKGSALKPGDCIGIVAPASGMDGMDISLAVQKLQSWGYKVKLAPNLYSQSGYLAGSDTKRAADLNTFLPTMKSRRFCVCAAVTAVSAFWICSIMKW